MESLSSSEPAFKSLLADSAMGPKETFRRAISRVGNIRGGDILGASPLVLSLEWSTSILATKDFGRASSVALGDLPSAA